MNIRVLNQRNLKYKGKNDFEPAKYQGKWSVYDKTSRTYSNIGVGKKNAVKKAEELNKPSDEYNFVKGNKQGR